VPCAHSRVPDADAPQDDDDSEDAEDEDAEDGDDADGARPPGKGAKPPPPALGKRKAPPPARRPPKKAKRERISRFLIFLTRAALTDVDRLPGGPRVEVEYEQEVESVPLTRQALADW
jgi:protein MAK16